MIDALHMVRRRKNIFKGYDWRAQLLLQYSPTSSRQYISRADYCILIKRTWGQRLAYTEGRCRKTASEGNAARHRPLKTQHCNLPREKQAGFATTIKHARLFPDLCGSSDTTIQAQLFKPAGRQRFLIICCVKHITCALTEHVWRKYN